jgi:ABC-type transporter Mla maintaining outer membrane lipid asymmetry ATPase subunit MlaF
MDTPLAILEMQGVQVAALRDPSLIVLEELTWSVRPGEFWVVAGSQHSGKSDLLLHAAGLMTPCAGTCRVFGCDTHQFDETELATRLRVGFAFADGKLFNQLTLAENVALPLRYHQKLTDAETVRRVEALLELLELTPLADALPGNVAVVWRRRAALARALALQPELLLLDNPNGGLTARHRQWQMNFLDELWRGHGFFGGRPMTLVATTDDLPPWQHPRRKFAGVHAGRFTVLGAWGGDQFIGHGAVKELLPWAEEQVEGEAHGVKPPGGGDALTIP